MVSTCPVASVVEVNSKRARLMLGLPGGWRAVLVVGVGVVVVGVLPRQHGGPWRAAHGRGDKRIGEVRSTLFHDPPGLIHDLHGAWMRERVREDLSYYTKGDIKSALLTALLQREQASSLSLPLQNTRHRQDNDISYFINSLFVTFQPLRGNVLIVCNMGIHMTPVVCAWECVCLEIYDTSFIFTSHTLFIKSFNCRIYFSKPICFCSFSAFIWPSLV